MNIQQRLNIKFPLVIDGGLSNELENQGCDLNHKLWTARLLDSHVQAIKNVHLNYMRAGAQCIASASYQASIPGLIENGYSKKEAKALLNKSIILVKETREAYYKEKGKEEDVYIVASIGPYGAYKADGSEYRGNYGLSFNDLKEFHQERLEIFDKSVADIIAFETIPDKIEAEVIAELTMNCDKPCWVSFSCKDDQHISDGTPISKVANLFADHPSFFAIGANCIPPDFVPGIIASLKEYTKEKHIIIYPNSGGYYDSKGKKWYANNEKFALKNHVDLWRKLGADIIGGCCKIGSSEIAELKSHINSQKSS